MASASGPFHDPEPSPLWAENWLDFAPSVQTHLTGVIACALEAQAAVRTSDPDRAANRLRRAGQVLAGREPQLASGHANDNGPDALLLAAEAAREAFAARSDIVQGLGRVLQAAERDARLTTCGTWGELLMMGQFALVPIGRAFLAAIDEETETARRKTDSLFLALFVLERLKAAGTTFARTGRPDLPLGWLRESGLAPKELGRADGIDQRRTVIDRMLESVRQLLVESRSLAPTISDRNSRMAIAFLHRRARRLLKQLGNHDPFIAPLPPDGRFAVFVCRLLARYDATVRR